MTLAPYPDSQTEGYASTLPLAGRVGSQSRVHAVPGGHVARPTYFGTMLASTTALQRTSPTASTSAPRLRSRPRVNITRPVGSRAARTGRRGGVARTRALFNPFDPESTDDPLLRRALREPVAFFGGVFAGMLGLSVDDEPLREWVDRTSEAAGMTRAEEAAAVEEAAAGGGTGDDDGVDGDVNPGGGGATAPAKDPTPDP